MNPRAFLVLSLLLLAAGLSGCGGTVRQLPGSPEEELAPAAASSGMEGIPPLGFYSWGEEGYVSIPLLGMYHKKDFSLGLFGILHVGTTRVDRTADGRASGVLMRDFNLLGFHNTTERQFLEGDRLVRERSRRLFWFLPAGSSREEIPALEFGGIRGAVPFWFYRNNYLWHVSSPLLLSHHSDEVNLGLLGILNLGLRTVDRGADGSVQEVRLTDLNLLGLWGSSERVYREGDHACRRHSRRLLWIFSF